MNLRELLAADVEDGERHVARITTDSRQLDAQTWWLAGRGVSRHALDFYDPNLNYAGVIYEPPHPAAQPDWIAVDQLNMKVGEIAARFYGHPSDRLTIFAVTGTDGKSSLVHLLAQGLDAAMLGTIGNGRLNQLQKASHTTADALSMQQQLAQFVDQGVEQVAMEVSSHALDQGRIAGVKVDVALFSNLSRDHLDYHGTMDAYFLAKSQLFARPIRHAIVNIDDSYGRRLIKEDLIYKEATIWAVSSRDAASVSADNVLTATEIELGSDGISFTLSVDGQSVRVHSRLLARFNVDNLLNVAACLMANGYSLKDCAAVLAKLHGVPGRVERIGLPEGRAAIVDYAHTPAALENALQGIRAHIKGKLWVVFGCGGNRDMGKRPLMAEVAERYADHVVLTDDNPRHEDPRSIIDQVLTGFTHPDNVQVVCPREAAIIAALEQMQAGDGLLIAGKGHEDYQIIGDTRHYFSDQQVVNDYAQR
ncbi:UDP-N-acetylmuramoyl-L-alanyl-D-glutamate--2,6-diaminopimelate ligase [Suttonella sp. R2A3]|uniref:UDP-N-acetylmuramoyl-L-alanyl-D-glutamate--2, 6-diaminopimelate ligase n=1 Tax=Suttonella sp. R2A3 TaxID=2908648 RepID=UPI001F2741CC|nr:UDP-N-acetylmuramoyl-L-alanyl-D-glutamate--2,6-diaminopimelate ligase [Suttonella sp. R2A3]UJF24609.1 UDP-N-acetylmuramoyl-L-alanyl-D-glutamate--2,6-diaminopimelate ligase [Suttonella sp. R2A3]